MARAANVNVCNQAIVEVGGDIIETIGEDSRTGLVAEEIFVPTRDAIIEEADWTFAVKRATLSADGTDPEHGYDNQFTIPVDMARIINVSSDATANINNVDWRLESGFILANEEIIYIKYITKSGTDLARWTEKGRQALVYAMAAKMAIPLAKSRTLKADMEVLAKDKLDDAKMLDGLQGRSEKIKSNRFKRARYRDGGGRVGPFV